MCVSARDSASDGALLQTLIVGSTNPGDKIGMSNQLHRKTETPSLEHLALCRVREQYPGLQRKGFSKAISMVFKKDSGFDDGTDEWDRLYAKAYRVWFIPDGWLQDTDGTFIAIEIEDSNPLSKEKLWGYAELCMLLDACDNTPINPLRLYVFDRYGHNQRELNLLQIFNNSSKERARRLKIAEGAVTL
jgi:hypothetical protein